LRAAISDRIIEKEWVMSFTIRTTIAAALCLAVAAPLAAQHAPDPSGHWEGTVTIPDSTLVFTVDLARKADGGFAGTISLAQEKVTGLPLAKIDVNGSAIAFSARSDQGFSGTLSADGQIIGGDFSMKEGTVPFRMARLGDARLEPVPSSPRIGETLEGTWNGTIEGRQRQVRLVLRMTNHADGSASGSIFNMDEGGLELPVVIAQEDANVTLKATVVESSFVGVLNADGTALAGTLHLGAQQAPLTFTKAAGK
jgi:hypothetical protein